MAKIKVTRLIHKGWKEWQSIQKERRKTMMFGLEGWFGKYQYVYSSPKGKISLIKIRMGGLTKEEMFWGWEIYTLETNQNTQLEEIKLFDGVETFATKQDAIKRIKQLL